MAYLLAKFKDSFKEIRRIRNLCTLSFFVILKIVVSSFKIVLAPGVQISFGFLVYLVVGSFFGPFVSIIFAILSFFLSFILGFQTVFHMGFLVSFVVSALIYGIFLYKFKFGFLRVFAATIVHDLVVHFFLNIIWLSQLFHNGNFYVAFAFRFVKGLILLPIDCVLSCLVVIFLKKVVRLLNLTFV